MNLGDTDVWSTKAYLASICALILLLACFASAQAPKAAPGYYDPLPQDTGDAGLKQELRKLQNTGRLMMVVAHPDDEDGGLLTREARGQGVQTLLMTLTRGEGGQNKTGDTFSDELGVLRTLELLAADRYYGVEQRFSRVADFGYSKTPEETFQKWGGHDVPLADIVRVIRQFRPDVLVARFSGTDRDGHGHHQASAILTKEAFRAAADPNRFPEQIKEGLQPWQAKKLYVGNVCGFGAATCADENYTVKINTGEVDPVLGMSYAQFAIEGLKHQQSQGLGDISIPSGPRYAFYKLADSTIPKTTDDKGHEKDLFDGIDTSPPKNIAALAREAYEEAAKSTGSALRALVEMRDDLVPISNTYSIVETGTGGSAAQTGNDLMHQVMYEKLAQCEAALRLALGLSASLEARSEETVPRASVASSLAVSPGQEFTVHFHIENGRLHAVKVENLFVDPGDLSSAKTAFKSTLVQPTSVPRGEDYSAEFKFKVPLKYPFTMPYWHRDDPERQAINDIEDEEYLTLPFPAAAFTGRFNYSVSDLNLAAPRTRHAAVIKANGTISTPILTLLHDGYGTNDRAIPLAIVPAFSVVLEPAQQALPLLDGKETTVSVGVSSNLTGAPRGSLHLDLPTGWRAEPPSIDVDLAKRGDKRDFSFKVFPVRLSEGRAEIHAVLDAGGKKYSEGYTLVTREDLGAFYYFEPAVQHVSVVDVKVPKDLKVGYIMGAGDDIPNVLQQVGMNVTLIPAEKIAEENLSQYGTIVLGVRAFDTHKDLVANNKKLLDFVSSGGTLIVQNNNSTGDFNGEHLTPYSADLSRSRVSVEEAPVTILDPGNPIFHYPNEISQKDFDGWVQERGLYFMDSWDDHFKPLLSCHDPGESDQKGGMIEAKYGKGTYIYTGYAFFRQLPAGVPGAIRLFVNLVSAGNGH